MAENEDFYKARNRGTLKKLASGMEVTRATKHEPIDFDVLSAEELRNSTNDRSGRKFLAEWTLPKIVEFLEEQATSNGWKLPPGARTRVRVPMNRKIGYVSGRWIHAYPDED